MPLGGDDVGSHTSFGTSYRVAVISPSFWVRSRFSR